MWIPTVAIIYGMIFTGGFGIGQKMGEDATLARMEATGELITIRPEYAALIPSKRFRINKDGNYYHPKRLVIRGGVPKSLRSKQ